MPYQRLRKICLPVSASILLAALLGCSEQNQTGSQPNTEKSSTAIQTLLDFDQSGDQAEFSTEDGAAIKFVRAANSADGKALEMSFSASVVKPLVRIQPKQPWNWSSQDEIHIAFDASNTGRESIQLFLYLADTEGGIANHQTNIAANESGTYYVILKGAYFDIDPGFKKRSVPAWETNDEMMIFRFGQQHIDLSDVSELGFFVQGNMKDKQLLVDNLRLRPNPDYGTDYIEQYVDEFGQNSRVDFPIKVHSLEELKATADAELAELAISGPMPDRSRFGGWKQGPELEATGYYRTEKVNGKWWMVDPEGYLFFSHGLANVRMANLTTLTGIDFKDDSVRYINPEEVTPEDSIGIVQVSDDVRETRYIASELRHKMFNWLPSYDDELADHYSYRRTVLSGPLTSGETFSFYRANLERRYGQTEPESYIKTWQDVTLARMLDWGFTSMGNWVDPAFYPNQQVPYFANGWIIGDFKTLSSPYDVWSPMPDPFDPQFVRRAEITIDVIAEEIQQSPWCVGIFVDNEKSWGLREGNVQQRYGLILDALSKDAAESPAKQAFTRYLSERYANIDTLNKRWNTRLQNWDQFSTGVELAEYSEQAAEDFSSLLELLSEEYFRVVHDSLEARLPNHLYMGVRMASWGMPEETIKASIKYSDVLSFNVYKEGLQPHAWTFLKDIDLPSLIGEFHIGSRNDTGLLHTGLVMADNQADRAAKYLDYMDSLLAHDSMVGAHWFQYVDSPLSGRTYDGENYNVGFVSNTDIPYPEMVDAAKKFNSTLYSRRYGEQK